MAKKKQTIYSKDWASLHPYQGSARTDFYYTTIANKIYTVLDNLLENEISDENLFYLEEEEKKQLACTLTSYFEDIISKAGIFRAFIEEHYRKYNSPLPFFPCNDYANGEINTEDIQFLIWHYFMQLSRGEIPYSPETPIFSRIAQKVMEILDEEYESAPANEKLKDFFILSPKESTNLYSLQARFAWLATESYLFQFNGRQMQEEVDEIVASAKEDGTEEYLPDMVNVLCNDFAYNLITEFMQYSPAQWLAILLGKEHPAYEALKNLSRKYSGYFDFVDEDKYNARFRHIITGEIIEVTQKSLKGFPEDMKSDKTSLYAGFVRWQNEWWIMGLVNTYPKSEDLTEEIDKRAEEESHIFEEKTDLPENEQEIILKDILEDTDLEEGETPLTSEETAWIAVLSDELGVSFMENAVQKGKVPGLKFDGENGHKLLHDNLDFILRYIKR